MTSLYHEQSKEENKYLSWTLKIIFLYRDAISEIFSPQELFESFGLWDSEIGTGEGGAGSYDIFSLLGLSKNKHEKIAMES